MCGSRCDFHTPRLRSPCSLRSPARSCLQVEPGTAAPSRQGAAEPTADTAGEDHVWNLPVLSSVQLRAWRGHRGSPVCSSLLLASSWALWAAPCPWHRQPQVRQHLRPSPGAPQHLLGTQMLRPLEQSLLWWGEFSRFMRGVHRCPPVKGDCGPYHLPPSSCTSWRKEKSLMLAFHSGMRLASKPAPPWVSPLPNLSGIWIRGALCVQDSS